MKSESLWRRYRPTLVKYGAAVLLVAAATIATYLLRKIFPATPNSLFFCAVVLSVWLGGWGPGAFVSLLACLTIFYCLPPPLSAGRGWEAAIIRFVVFLLASLFISWICHRQKRAQAALEQAREELEQRVNERTGELTAANARLKIEIAEREGAEKALQLSETKLKDAQRIGHIGYWERDLISDRITWSDETCRIFGLPKDCGPISQGQLQELIHPDDRPLQKKALEDAVQKCRPYNVEYRIVCPHGEVRFVHVRDEIVCDDTGRPVQMFGTVQDVTERKRAEETVRESQQLLEQVLATLPVAVAVTNQAGDIILVNAASKRIWGDTIVAGRERWAQSKGFWHETGKRIDQAEWASARALATGEISVNELIDIETFDGQQKTILNSAAPIHNGEGQIVGAVIINEDVTEQKKSEDKLRQTESDLARIARLTMMGELTASIAHEVNQPLAAVVTNANAVLRWLAMSPPNLAETREAVQRIARDGNRASEVIRRIRELMKKREPARKPINLNEMVRETVALTQPELKRKKVSLKTELAPELPLVSADFVQVQQVLLNLVINAADSLSAVPEHSRALRISTNHPEPEAVQVIVQDTGIGIKPEDRERLFEPFFTTKPGGLGMGLAISRSIVEAQGGRLWVAPNNGQGATFQFTLPVHGGGEA